jgi:hypothetical protein
MRFQNGCANLQDFPKIVDAQQSGESVASFLLWIITGGELEAPTSPSSVRVP